MSVIAFDGRFLAADMAGTVGNLQYKSTKLRLSRNHNLVIGDVGIKENGLQLLEWLEAGGGQKTFPKSQEKDEFAELIVGINTTLGPRVYTIQQSPTKMWCEMEFWAWGSGAALAIGAMAALAGTRRIGTAEEAVKIASRYNIHCANGVVMFDLKELPIWTTPQG